jgi:ABC-type sugar transport system ATPase subunit
MTGIHQPDSGEILLNNQAVRIESSMAAQAYGIAAVYQESMVFPDLNVAKNIFISHRNRGNIVNWQRMYREVEQILSQMATSRAWRAKSIMLIVRVSIPSKKTRLVKRKPKSSRKPSKHVWQNNLLATQAVNPLNKREIVQ